MTGADDSAPRQTGDATARYPWLTFLLVGFAPAILLSGNVLGATVSPAALLPAFAAALVAAGQGADQPIPGHRTKRLLVAAGVCVVLAEVTLVETGFSGLAWTALVSAVPIALTAWVLSGVYSPSPHVRRLVRRLALVRAQRPAWLVAALAGPLAAAVSVAVCSRIPGLSVSPPGSSSAGLLAGWVVTGVFSAALAALGWYGFVARRLLPRLCPLATGLLIGAAQWLAFWALTLDPGSLADPFFLFRLAGSAAAGIAGVWVFARSSGSLLPVWLMGTLLIASERLVSLLVTADDVARAGSPAEVFTAAQVALALALVAGWRMWRRPAAGSGPASTRGLSLS